MKRLLITAFLGIVCATTIFAVRGCSPNEVAGGAAARIEQRREKDCEFYVAAGIGLILVLAGSVVGGLQDPKQPGYRPMP